MTAIKLRPVSEEPEIVLPAWILGSNLTAAELATLCAFIAIGEGLDQEIAANWMDRTDAGKEALRSLKRRGVVRIEVVESKVVIDVNYEPLRAQAMEGGE